MGEEIISLGDIDIEKHKFHSYKNSILLNDVDLDSILISNKISSVNVLLIEDEELLKKYNDIWNKVSNSIEKNSIANPSPIKNFRKRNS